MRARLRHFFASSAVRAGADFVAPGRAQAMIKVSAPNLLRIAAMERLSSWWGLSCLADDVSRHQSLSSASPGSLTMSRNLCKVAQAVQSSASPVSSRVTEPDFGRVCRSRRRVPLHRLCGPAGGCLTPGRGRRRVVLPAGRIGADVASWTASRAAATSSRPLGADGGRALESCVGSAT